MAIKALAIVQEVETDGTDNTKVRATVQVAIFGNDIGDLSRPGETITLDGLTPTTLVVLNSGVASGVKDWMEGHGIEFGLLDTVLVY